MLFSNNFYLFILLASSPNENEARRVTVQDEEVDNNEEEVTFLYLIALFNFLNRFFLYWPVSHFLLNNCNVLSYY